MSTAANRTLRIKLCIVAVGMFGFGFALVPFYYQICAVTGINNVVEQSLRENNQIDTSRLITIEFDANLRNHLPWRFIPEKGKMQVHPGQIAQVMYSVENKSDKHMVGQAIPSYGPSIAGRYFKKLECFCFSKQQFAPGEIRKMPVLFAIDSNLPQDIRTITLSYSFFEINTA